MNEEAQKLLMMFIKDMYSMQTDRVSKKTAFEMIKFVGKDNKLQHLVNNGNNKEILKYRVA